MAHDPDFDLQLDPLNTAFDGSSDVSSLPESIHYQAEFDPGKLAMIQSAQALLADAKRRLERFQKNTPHVSSAVKKKQLMRLEDAVIQAEVWLNTLINS
jgi:hypothetical protein